MTADEIDEQLNEWREKGAGEMADRVPARNASTTPYREKIFNIVSGGAQLLMREEAERRRVAASESVFEKTLAAQR